MKANYKNMKRLFCCFIFSVIRLTIKHIEIKLKINEPFLIFIVVYSNICFIFTLLKAIKLIRKTKNYELKYLF